MKGRALDWSLTVIYNQTMVQNRKTLLLVGGGLSNGLLAYLLSQRRPEVRVVMLDKGSTLGEGRTWSFFQSDLSESQLEWLKPFISRSWAGYSIHFPGLQRDFKTSVVT